MNFTGFPTHCKNWSPALGLSLMFALMLGLAGCSDGSGGAAYKQYRASTTAFLDVVKELGGSAESQQFRVAGREGKAWVIDLSGAQFSPEKGIELMKLLEPAGYIAKIDFSGSSLTDEQLVKFDNDASGYVVMDLNLSNTAITDAAIDKLENFRALRNVNISGSKITKAAVDRWLDRRRKNPATPAMFHNPTITL